MEINKGLTRRKIIRSGLIGGAGLAAVGALAGCGEAQIITETKVQEVIKEVPVERVVTQIVEKEKVVQVEVEVEVEKVVTQVIEKEKIVTVEAAPAPKPQAITLVFSTWWALERGGFGKYERKYMDLFQATYPHVTIEYRNWPWADYHTKLLTQAAAGTAPDVFAQSNVFYPKFIKKGGALSLDEFTKGNAEVDIEDFVPVSLGLSSWEGKLYGLPHISSSRAFLYNMEVMEDAGVTDLNEIDAAGEWNWDTLLETLQKITKRDGNSVERLGMNDPGLRFRSSMSWGRQNGGEALKQPTLDEFPMNEPAYAEAVQWIAELVHKHKVAAGAGDIVVSGRSDLNSGRLGILETWTNFSSHKGFPIDVVYPAVGPVNRTAIVHTNSLGVAAKTKHPAEGFDYIAMQTSKTGDRDQAEYGMGICLRKSNMQNMIDVTKAEFGVPHAEVMEEVIATGRIFDVNEYHMETLDTVNPVMEEIREGADAKQKLDELKPIVDKIFAPMRA